MWKSIYCTKCGKFIGKINIVECLKVLEGHAIFGCINCKARNVFDFKTISIVGGYFGAIERRKYEI